MIGYGQSQYKKTQVSTVDSGRLIILLYEGAANFLLKAKEAMAAQEHQAVATHINRAMDIIDELDVSLNLSEGGDIASNLRQLYRFMVRHLIKARAENSLQCIDDVVQILGDLNQAWKEAMNKQEAQQVLSNKTAPRPSTKSVTA